MFDALRARGLVRTALTWAVGLSILATTILVTGVTLGFVPASVFGIRELVAVAIRTFVAGGAALILAMGLAAPAVVPVAVLVAGAAGLGLIGAGFSVATLAFARRAAGLPIRHRLAPRPQPVLPPVI